MGSGKRTWAAAFAAVLALAGCGGGSDDEANTEVLQTASGAVRGVAHDGIDAFKGIRYAAPPVGALRWRPPEPAAPWTGVLEARDFGATCAQTNELGGFAARSESEDCLFLNVFAPTERSTATKLPVMVWIHGGGLFSGSSNEYDPTRMVKEGGVVLVSFNYRLNVFGFLSQSALNSEGHPAGNYGFMDQQLALRWVQENIAAFGGDPKRVTIFGESAGGSSVLTQLSSPRAEGLFHRAIVQSGSATEVLKERPLADSTAAGAQLAKALGCKGTDAACLRSKSVAEIMKKAPALVAGWPFPTVDGYVLDEPVSAALAAGRFNRVPVINGSNADEQTWFLGMEELASGKPMDAETYAMRIASEFAPHGAEILAAYPASRYPSPSEAYVASAGDHIAHCPGRRLNQSMARFTEVYSYEFADRTAPASFPDVSFPYGAAHTLEIQYLFDGFAGAGGTRRSLIAQQRGLSQRMIGYWTRFATTGEPNGVGLDPWLAYGAAGNPTIALKNPTEVVSDDSFRRRHHCDLWDSLQ